MQTQTDTRRDRLVGIQMQIHLARRDRDEAKDQGIDPSEHEARIRELQDKYHEITWKGAA